MVLSLVAPAKVNLWLRVLGRRADGYHEIESCLQAVQLADEVRAETALRVALDVRCETIAGGDVPTGPDNLVWRAADAFRRATGHGAGARFTLIKRIPAGGGLGGGSSDAAAALLLMNALSGQPLDAAALHDLALGLGADVPFFLRGGTQIARGIGERLDPVADPPRFYFVLLLPPFGTSTAAVYGNWSAGLTAGGALPRIPESKLSPDQGPSVPTRPESFVNDLETPAMRLHPELAALRDRVREKGFPAVRMSGSGSTLFLAFSTRVEAERALGALQLLREEGVSLLMTESAQAAGSAVRDSTRLGDNRGGER